jgi:hypothetical protein
MLLQWAPPMCHHLDSETEPAGWYARVQYLDHEELRESPYELGERSVSDDNVPDDSPAKVSTPDGVTEFFDDCVRIDETDPKTRLAKEDVRLAYAGFADRHGFEMYDNAEQFGQWFRAHIPSDICEDCRRLNSKHGDRRPAYKYARLNEDGEQFLERAQSKDLGVDR